MTVVVLVVVCVAPALAFLLFAKGFDWVVAYEPRGRTHKPDPATELPALGADLRRLAAEHRWLLKADVPARRHRLRVVELAYDDTLLRAGRLLDVELPDPPLAPATRLQAEAELSTHGFTW